LANGSDTLTDFDGGLTRPPLLAPAPSVNAAALLACNGSLYGCATNYSGLHGAAAR